MKNGKSNGTKSKSTNGETVVEDPQQVQEAIRLKAYELYLERGGNDFENWVTAEQIVLKNGKNYR